MHFQPMTVSQVLDNTFRSYRKNFGAIITFTLLFQGSIMLLISLLPILAEILYSDALLFLLPFIYLAYVFFLLPIFFGGITRFVSSDIQGTKLSLGDMLGSIKELFSKFTSTNAILILVVILIVIAFVIVLSMLFGIIIAGAGLSLMSINEMAASTITIVLVLVMLIITIALMVIVWLWVYMVYPVVEYEGLRNWKAIGRAIKLAYSKVWRVLGIILLFGLIYLLIALALFALLALATYAFQSGSIDWLLLLESTAFLLLSNLLSVFLAPLVPVLSVWLYRDIRARVDGDDLALKIQNGDEDTELTTG